MYSTIVTQTTRKNNIQDIKINSDLISTLYETYDHEISVIPVNPKTKTPTIQAWKKYQYTLPNETDLFKWGRYAEGLAIITGSFNGVVVLDVDVKKENGFNHLRKNRKHLPITPVVRTASGGYHYYYRHPQNSKKVITKRNVIPHVDIRGDGGYALIPSTPGYEWVNGLSINDVPIAEMPKWLYELAIKEQKTEGYTVGKNKGVPSNEYSLLGTPPKTIQPLGEFNKDNLTEWYKQEKVANAFLKAMNLSKDIGQPFNCILPGHQDKKPSSSLYKGDNGVYHYKDWHGGNTEILLLPEVYASLHYKKVITMDKKRGVTDHTIGKVEFVVWSIRLLIDLGFIEGYQVNGKELPGGIKPSVKKVYEGFVRLLACKWLYEPNAATTFTRRFASVWSGVGERQAGESIQYLVKNGFIKVKKKEKFRGLEMNLYTISSYQKP